MGLAHSSRHVSACELRLGGDLPGFGVSVLRACHGIHHDREQYLHKAGLPVLDALRRGLAINDDVAIK